MALAAWFVAAVVRLAYVARAHSPPPGMDIMSDNGLPLPDLSGLWADSTRGGTEEQLVLQFFQPPNSAAVPPNSTYAVRRGLDRSFLGVCTVSVSYGYITRERKETTMICRSDDARWEAPQHGVVNVDKSEVHFAMRRQWQRTAQSTIASAPLGRATATKIKKVHVVFLNHYDVGYTDFINGVDNSYMHKYYPLAEWTSTQIPDYVYTTHPWLLERFLTCPCSTDAPCLATSLNNSYEKPLQCPSKEEAANLTAGLSRGDIVYNGGPFNIQPENMAPELFQAGFDLVRRIDARYRRNLTRTMSIRDVVYVTKAVLPHLQKNGITGLTIGSNPSCVPPQAPKLHRWVDPLSKADTVVAYHPYGYGGYGLKDCAESPNGVALCTDIRSDNTGPEPTIKQVQNILKQVQSEYPGAIVTPSSFDAFFEEVLPVKDQLPIIDLEAGDTWIHGNPSDPLKIAQLRGIQRAWIACLQSGEPRCATTDPAIQNMTFFLLKAPEHTWGAMGVGWIDWNTTIFRSNLSQDNLFRAAASWAEQRLFNELAVRALEETGHPLAANVRKEVEIVENVVAPDLTGLVSLPINAAVTTKEGFKIALRFDGAIASLQDANGVDWASDVTPLGAFVYQTFNDSEWKPFTFSYMNDHKMWGGFCKQGSNNYTQSALWRPSLKRLLVSGSQDAAEFFIAVMEMPEIAFSYYGAPREIYLKVSSAPDMQGNNVDLSYVMVGKMPTMLAEASMVTFQPAPKLKPKLKTGTGSAWRIDKLGQPIDPEAVMDGGNQFIHGTWKGTVASTEAGEMSIEALDTLNMHPITADFPIGNPLPASYLEADAKAGTGLSRLSPGSVRGMAANIHNNFWSTNYPFYYPYFDGRFCSSPLNCRNSNALARFQLRFGTSHEGQVFV